MIRTSLLEAPANLVVYRVSTGEITAVARNALFVFREADETVMEGSPNDPANLYVDTSGPEPVFVPRPFVPDLEQTYPGRWTATGCPDGMEVQVWDADLGTLLAEVEEVNGAVQISLPDPGPYRLVSVAPFPYRARTLEVEVT